MIYGLLFGVAMFVSIGLTPFGMGIARKYDMVARPGDRRQHQGVIPRLGGLSIMGAYLLGIGLIQWLIPIQSAADAQRLTGVFLGTIIVFIGGVLDDRYELSFRSQLLIQFSGALIANYHTVFLERISNPMAEQGWFGGNEIIVFAPWVAWLITSFWIMGMMNAVNWLDGLDGLAGGVGIIALLLFGIHAYQLGQDSVAAFPIVLAGGMAGFLWFNFAPARLFLGSAGVYILGYNLATLSFLAPAKTATALLVLALPLLDGVWRIIDRSRRGTNPFKGDRGHLHYVLQDRGWATQKIVLFYYSVTAVLGISSIMIPSGPLKFGLILFVGFGLLFFLIWFTRPKKTPPSPLMHKGEGE